MLGEESAIKPNTGKEHLIIQVKKCFRDFISILIESLKITVDLDYHYIINQVMMMQIICFLTKEGLIGDRDEIGINNIKTPYLEILKDFIFYDHVLNKIKQSFSQAIQELEMASKTIKKPESKKKIRFLIRLEKIIPTLEVPPLKNKSLC
jgi:hypothetical protein